MHVLEVVALLLYGFVIGYGYRVGQEAHERRRR